MHEITGCLKLFLRQLDAPLIPYEQYKSILATLRNKFKRRLGFHANGIIFSLLHINSYAISLSSTLKALPELFVSYCFIIVLLTYPHLLSIGHQDDETRATAIKSVLNEMPATNLQTLAYLMRHLHR